MARPGDGGFFEFADGSQCEGAESAAFAQIGKPPTRSPQPANAARRLLAIRSIAALPLGAGPTWVK